MSIEIKQGKKICVSYLGQVLNRWYEKHSELPNKRRGPNKRGVGIFFSFKYLLKLKNWSCDFYFQLGMYYVKNVEVGIFFQKEYYVYQAYYVAQST